MPSFDPLARTLGSASHATTLLGRPQCLTRPYGPTPLTPTEPRCLVDLAVKRARRREETKELDVVVDCRSRIVWVCAQLFAEALHELVDNALRASRPSEPVRVDVSDTADGDVLWQVHDTGHGMSEPTLGELGRVRYAERRAESGMGVALAWEIVDAHGGLLRFESTLGVGTTASIWLPWRG